MSILFVRLFPTGRTWVLATYALALIVTAALLAQNVQYQIVLGNFRREQVAMQREISLPSAKVTRSRGAAKREGALGRSERAAAETEERGAVEAKDLTAVGTGAQPAASTRRQAPLRRCPPCFILKSGSNNLCLQRCSTAVVAKVGESTWSVGSGSYAQAAYPIFVVNTDSSAATVQWGTTDCTLGSAQVSSMRSQEFWCLKGLDTAIGVDDELYPQDSLASFT